MMTDEQQQEFDAHAAWVADLIDPADYDHETPEPEAAPDEDYADMSIAERDMWLDEFASEDTAWHEDRYPY